MGIVDACVHPVMPAHDDLNALLPQEYREQALPKAGIGVYQLPIDGSVPGSRPSDGSLPGSDPELLRQQVIDAGAADDAVLVPLGRGHVLETQLACAIDTATNEWLARTWLEDANPDGRFKGSIRACTRSPQHAVGEIERWADHPAFVQVVVPLESPHAYGEQVFFEIWEAAARHGLPVAVHSDHSAMVMPQTLLGFPTTYLEAYAQRSFYGASQLASLIAHGVFDRLESLVFVFADGAFDFMQAIAWRLDKDWRPTSSQVPWMSRAPSEYFADHVRFVVHDGDGPDDPDEFARLVELNELGETLLFGSNYPHWDHLDAAAFAASLPDDLRARVMEQNARELYGLPQRPGV